MPPHQDLQILLPKLRIQLNYCHLNGAKQPWKTATSFLRP